MAAQPAHSPEETIEMSGVTGVAFLKGLHMTTPSFVEGRNYMLWHRYMLSLTKAL